MNDFEAVRHIISETAGLSEADILRDSDLSGMGLNELDLTEILMELEDKYDILIDNEEHNIHSYNDMLQHIML